ncbi:MAG: deoxyribodipyrimidine photolyase [Actinobacteria bacterium HGW-Actinobacteria-5]|nr:MAG: deoxyribodipyrimidine photolyase [Actinobacteria bacterium HGW-Actinobacteria-5]
MSRPSLLWLRRDLRRSDHPALVAAAASGPVLPVFVLDPEFLDPAGPVRRGWLAATLRALEASYDGHLCLLRGDPRTVIPALALEVGAREVHTSVETEPGGAARDAAVRAALEAIGVAWVGTGSPYAVTPGRVRNAAGDGYRVFTPFLRAWRTHGWSDPAVEPDPLALTDAPSDASAWDAVDAALAACPIELPPAGQEAALARWEEFRSRELTHYDEHRDLPALDGTSRLSAYLKFGVLHPRTLLADLAGRQGDGAQRFITELAWREFYADVLHHHPGSLASDLNPLEVAYDEPDARFEAWREGRTGYPIVDAGMRQLLASGWIHNRVRMITASFLTKDLHVWWPHGAEHFLAHLIDGDLASNSHGWQWVAGTGTDAAPYYRVFNPISQGERFDPDGVYVRRWIPELAHLAGAAAHRPWQVPDGYAHGYPVRIVDHAAERVEALARYERARLSRSDHARRHL